MDERIALVGISYYLPDGLVYWDKAQQHLLFRKYVKFYIIAKRMVSFDTQNTPVNFMLRALSHHATSCSFTGNELKEGEEHSNSMESA